MKYIIYLLPVLAGAAVALQSSINAQLRSAVGSPLTAGLISFGVGTMFFLIIVFVTRQLVPNWETIINIRGYKLIGGLLGAMFVTIIPLIS